MDEVGSQAACGSSTAGDFLKKEKKKKARENALHLCPWWVNGLHLYGPFIHSALQMCINSLTHSHTYSHTDGGGNHARQGGFSVLLKDTLTQSQEKPGDGTRDFLVSRWLL